MELQAGDRFDRYVVESVIGRGGMGVVYLARDTRLDRPVALKVLAPELANDEDFRARFETEARIAAALDEPHVVPVYEAGEHDGQLFLAMRYVAGFDLDTLLRRNGAMPAERAVALIEQLASAADAAHAAGLVHRDIKPANVLIASAASGADHVYLSDFGLARTQAQRRLTRTGQFIGSLEYAAPEQIENGPLDARTDVYALGEVLFACLTGRAPFEAESDAALLYAHLQTAPRAPSSLNGDVPVALDAVVAQAMARRPADRYATALELASAAAVALTGPVAAPVPPGPATKTVATPRSASSRKTVTVMSVSLLGAKNADIGDPEAMGADLERGELLVRTVAAAHGGTFDALVGESAVAVFGVPQLHEDDALRAVRAAAQLSASVGGIGIATGEVLTGDEGARRLVTGEPVNAAARLEQAAQEGEILLAESTYLFVRDVVEAEPREITTAGRASRAMTFGSLRESETRRLDETSLVGRNEQLGELRRHWQAVVDERAPRLVTIVGPAGIGKSRLAFALSDTIDARTAGGRCLPYGEGVTYWPIREIILSVAGVTDADAASTAQARIADLLAADPDGPMLAALVATAVGLGQAQAPQSDVFWAVRRVFEDLARQKPTLILIEDLEWAEDTLLDMIEYVVDLASDAPSLIVATTRPELLERRPGWGSNRENADLVRLDPLVPAMALELVRAQQGGEAIPAQLAERICATADGNPLFVEEIVGGLRDSPALRQLDGRWVFSGDPDVVEIPPTIRALLGARIERVPAEERVILEAAAVIGRSFESEALVELIPGSDRASLGPRLRSLVRRELIQADRAMIGSGDAFRFRHVLVRDAAYGALPKSRRAALHSTYARWLAKISGDRIDEYAEIIGYHLAEAYDYQAAREPGSAATSDLAIEAAGYLGTAGERANSRGDLAAAAKLLARSIALTPAESPALPEMLVALAGVRRSLGEYKGARQALGQVLESTGKGEVEELEGRNSAAARAFSAALEMAERHDLGRLRMEALSGLLLNELLGATAVSAAVTRCEQVLEQSNEPHVLAATLDTYALLLGMSDRTHDAIAAEERALRIAADLDDRLHEGLYRGQTLAVVYALAGDLERAQVEARRGCELLLNLEAQAWLSSAACVLVEIEISRGNLQEADRWLSVAEASSVATDIDARTRAAVSRSRLALIGGEPEVARALIGVAAKSVEGTELLYLQGIVAAAEACVAAATGDGPLALLRLAEAAQIHDLKGDAARSRRARELADRLATDAQAWRTVALV